MYGNRTTNKQKKKNPQGSFGSSRESNTLVNKCIFSLLTHQNNLISFFYVKYMSSTKITDCLSFTVKFSN